MNTASSCITNASRVHCHNSIPLCTQVLWWLSDWSCSLCRWSNTIWNTCLSGLFKDYHVEFPHFWLSMLCLDHWRQSGIGTLPKWESCTLIGIYAGRSPSHASNIALILNPKIGHVSPQFHVVFDDDFTTVQKCLHWHGSIILGGPCTFPCHNSDVYWMTSGYLAINSWHRNSARRLLRQNSISIHFQSRLWWSGRQHCAL